MDDLSTQIHDELTAQLKMVAPASLLNLMERYGAADLQELANSFSRELPTIAPKDLLATHPRLEDLIKGGNIASGGTFEKSPTHDKMGHEKIPDGYDSAPYSRTYRMEEFRAQIEREINRGNSFLSE